MAFSMIEVIRNVRIEINFSELDMRIGIHTVFLLINIILYLKKGRYYWRYHWNKYCSL